MSLRIGVDVGGTNTDVAVLDGTRVIASTKSTTTPDVTSGILNALTKVLEDVDVAEVSSVIIGTTHFINAIAQARGLEPVAFIRLATPPQSMFPHSGWPEHLRSVVGEHIFVCAGGSQFDGRPLSKLDEDGVRAIAADIRAAGLRRVALSSVFSSVNPTAEDRAAEILAEELPSATITKSADVGRVGLLERENATILNAALLGLAESVVNGLEAVVAGVGISARVLLSQNDGTVMSLDRARAYPIFTIASGPTNSMRGAALLTGLQDGVVIDVGGTTSDIGLLQNGFPRESTVAMSLAGVRSNFRIPDVFSLALGGGTIIADGGNTVGPASVGYRIAEEALVFGGSTLTFTDVAVAAGAPEIGEASKTSGIQQATINKTLAIVREQLLAAVERTKLSEGDVPVIVVGGGASLLKVMPGLENLVIPDQAGVANAVGAAFAEAGGEVDRTYSLATQTREEVLAEAQVEACQLAVASGADPDQVRVIDIEDVPLTHLPGGGAVHVRIKVVGPFAAIKSELEGATA